VGEVKAAIRRFCLALQARRRVAVGSAQHGGTAGGVAVPMEAGGGSRWKDENGPSEEMGRKPRWMQHKLFLFFEF
jgi:hypothetical protein